MIDIALQKELNAVQGKMLLDITLQIPEESFLAIYGPSGAGKTSLLRLIAGLMRPTQGTIQVNGVSWLNTQSNLFLPPQKRGLGFVFQDYALFPNMTVLENLRFALGSGQDPAIIPELLAFMELDSLKKEKPTVLSGGQQQRVALARALVQRPKILLLDEPLTALDWKMRTRLQDYLMAVHQKYKLTTLLISHDQSEILKMATQMVVLENGKVAQQGPPLEVFAQLAESNYSTLVGTLLSINKATGLVQVQLPTDEKPIQLRLSTTKLNTLKVGDAIELQAQVHPLQLRKL